MILAHANLILPMAGYGGGSRFAFSEIHPGSTVYHPMWTLIVTNGYRRHYHRSFIRSDAIKSSLPLKRRRAHPYWTLFLPTSTTTTAFHSLIKQKDHFHEYHVYI